MKKKKEKRVWLSSFDLFFSTTPISFFVLGSNRSVFSFTFVFVFNNEHALEYFSPVVVFDCCFESFASQNIIIIIIHHEMAFTKAFYEQAFERNLKAQTTTTTTTRTNNVGVAPTMTHTQRATTTAMFTAHSKKEVVRHM